MGGYLCSDRLNGRVAGALDLVIAGRRFEPRHGHFFAFSSENARIYAIFRELRQNNRK